MALYHTYRPRTFNDVAYQSHIIETIKNQVINGKVGHAYLFAGPRGVGKTTTARILAKAVNLELKPGTAEFNDTSDLAKEIDASRSIDIIEIDAASNTGVDSVREHIIENARFQPTSLKKKVFIIDEVHMLSNSAFNALLKTLEEPPAHVMFILATTELHKIPETIISRCQVFRFKRVPFDEMKTHLRSILEQEKVTVDDDVLERIINKSDGCVRDAMSLLEQVLASGETHITKDSVAMFLPTSDVSTTLTFLRALVNRDIHAGLGTIQSASTDGVRMDQFAHDTLELLRALMILKATGTYTSTGLDFNDSAKKELDALKQHISHIELVQLADTILKRKNQLSTAPIPELPMEMAVLEWCGHGSIDERHDVSKESTEVTVPTAKKKTTVDRLQTTTSSEVETSPLLGGIKGGSTSHQEPAPAQETVDSSPLTVDKNSSPSTVVSLDEVKKHWSAWISAIETDSPSLVFLLKMASCTTVEENVITLEVAYTFHRDKLLNTEINKKLANAFTDLLGTPISINVIIQEGEPSAQESDTELTNLTAAFGGQVIG